MSLRSLTVTVPAGGSQLVTGPGNNVLVEEFSAPFTMQRDAWEPDAVRAPGRFPSGERTWRNVLITNRSAAAALTVKLWVGFGDMEMNFRSNPITELVGYDIDLNDGDTQDFDYVDASGQRRLKFTLTIDPDYAYNHQRGSIKLFNKTTGKLLYIVGASAAGGGIVYEGNADIRIKNKYGANIASAREEIAVCQEFYAA